jgi:hypothetical protein
MFSAILIHFKALTKSESRRIPVMAEEKQQKIMPESEGKRKSVPKKDEELEKLTSIVQIDDSELPQSVKEKFKD